MKLPNDLASRGWIIRQPEANENSAPLYVRGARRKGDGYCETRKGFVYAYSIKEAREYDALHNYSEESE